MNKVQALLFDFDGVILDTYESYRQIVVDVLLDMGYEISLQDAVKRWKGLNAEQIATELTFEGFAKADEFLKVVHEKSKNYTVEKSMIVDGLLEILETCDLPKAICSNGRSIRLKSNLADVFLENHFAEVVGRDIAGNMKPNPDVYLIGAERLGMEIENCLAVEDSAVGLQAAVESGAITVAFTGTGGKSEELEALNPDYIIDDLAKILNIIEELNNGN
tara:strand:+ start:3500 stop:4156 length:657 start_codon:yes stop_codon:yes gene_type:complete